ncbi:unnamed protein product [Lactuca virosa]|uniref:Uncharacterized protein n=1 Tax=Lactuca virosa TaxID=75947 RepID=A0AAU9N2U0_9ASTR|nr:unnamed protein product [Lactuca virosa]
MNLLLDFRNWADAFSVDQLLETYCLVNGSSHGGSSSSVGGVPTNSFSPHWKRFQILMSDQFEQFLHEVSQENLRVVDGMKLASEEMLVNVGEMYADLLTRHRDAMSKVDLLENQKTLVQAKYETCLQENDVLHAQIVSKS